MRRGEIWWATLPPPVGERPVLLLSRDAAYAVRALVTVAPITTRTRGIKSEVPLGDAEGLPRVCVANLDSITTIPRKALLAYAGRVNSAELAGLSAAIHFALGLRD